MLPPPTKQSKDLDLIKFVNPKPHLQEIPKEQSMLRDIKGMQSGKYGKLQDKSVFFINCKEISEIDGGGALL